MTLKYERWVTGKSSIRDYEMINKATNLHGWTKNVYEFGCAFIHLSVFNYYSEQDPFSQLPNVDLNIIRNFMEQYHEFPSSSEINFQTMYPYLLDIFKKINNNLEGHLEDLEKNPENIYVM